MKWSDRFIIKEVGPDLMCYDSEKDEVHILNPTARAIRSLLCQGKTEEQIVGILRASSHAEGSQIEEDVRACIKNLIEKNLVDDSDLR